MPDNTPKQNSGTHGAVWLSTSAAAVALGVSERTIQRRAAKGKITARKVTDRDGEKWEVNLGAAIGADSDANGVTTGGATLNEREIAPVPPQLPLNGDIVPTGGAIGGATTETAFLRAQLEAMNEALKREQSAHEQTRQLLAGALQMASRQLPNAKPPEASQAPPTGAANTDNPKTAKARQTSGNRRGSGLAMLRDGIKRILGIRSEAGH